MASVTFRVVPRNDSMKTGVALALASGGDGLGSCMLTVDELMRTEPDA